MIESIIEFLSENPMPLLESTIIPLPKRRTIYDIRPVECAPGRICTSALISNQDVPKLALGTAWYIVKNNQKRLVAITNGEVHLSECFY